MWCFFKRSMRSVALVLVICLLAIPSSVSAAAKQAKPTPAPTLTQEQKQMVDKAAIFTEYTKHGIVFDKAGALKAGLPENFVNDMAGLYQRMNEKATKDNFQWDKLINSIKARKANPQQVTPGTERMPTQGDQSNKAGTVDPEWSRRTTWTYVQLTLDEWETQLIINALWAGAGASGVYAALTSLGIVTLPYAGMMGLAAAIQAFGAGYMGFVDTLGHNRGIYFRLYYWGSITIWHN